MIDYLKKMFFSKMVTMSSTWQVGETSVKIEVSGFNYNEVLNSLLLATDAIDNATTTEDKHAQ